MKLYYWKGKKGVTNFGDELNPWIWPKLIPDVLDEDQESIFVGIGTLLNDLLPQASLTVVFGSGVGYGKGLPAIKDKCKIYCLRGPLSAKALGTSQDLAVTDPAVLIRRLVDLTAQKRLWRFAYMPHWGNASPSWEGICQDLGFGYIDPRWGVEVVLSTLGRTEYLITEAMHGAIVADALRIPWVCVLDANNRDSLPFKWHDWCLSIGMDFAPRGIPRLSFRSEGTKFIGSTRRWALKKLAAAKLKEISKKAAPVLSDEGRLERLTVELEERLEIFKADIRQGQVLD